LIEAAQDFSHAISRFLPELDIAVANARERDTHLVSADAIKTIEDQASDVIDKAIRIGLLFGDESRTSEAAKDAMDAITEARDAILELDDLEHGKRSAELDKISESSDAADDAHDRFMVAAHKVISPTGFRPGTGGERP
jgi:Sec-independent protein translocase protein TatA